MHLHPVMQLKRAFLLGLVAGLATGCDSDGDDAGNPSAETESGDPTMLHPNCEAADPRVDATFSVAIDGWEVDGYGFFDVDDDCLISSLEMTQEVWITEVDCGDEETPRTATVTVAADSSETPDWGVGDEVRLRANYNKNEFGGFDWFELSRAGTLLMQGIHGGSLEGTGDPVMQAGATVSYDECDAPMDGSDVDEVGKLALLFEELSLVIISGQLGWSDVGDGRTLRIDVERAESGHCCHGSHFFKVLKRRILAQE